MNAEEVAAVAPLPGDERDPLPISPEAPDPVPDPEGELTILSSTDGDRKIKWKPKDSASVKKAKEKFAALRAKGYTILRRVKVTEFPEGNGAEEHELVASKKPGEVWEVVPAGTELQPAGPAPEPHIAVPRRAGG